MTCDHIRTVPGCPTCDAEIAAFLAARAAEPPPAKASGRRVRTLTEARSAFPNVEQVPGATVAELSDLKDRYLRLQPEPSPAAHKYAARNRALFSPDGLAQATPGDLWAFITSPTMAAPGNLGTFYKGWKENGPESTAASLRRTIEHLLRGPGEEEDRLTELVEGGTYGVGVVLLMKVLCVMQPDRFIALLPTPTHQNRVCAGQRPDSTDRVPSSAEVRPEFTGKPVLCCHVVTLCCSGAIS